jgi:hypothetical protein
VSYIIIPSLRTRQPQYPVTLRDPGLFTAVYAAPWGTRNIARGFSGGDISSVFRSGLEGSTAGLGWVKTNGNVFDTGVSFKSGSWSLLIYAALRGAASSYLYVAGPDDYGLALTHLTNSGRWSYYNGVALCDSSGIVLSSYRPTALGLTWDGTSYRFYDSGRKTATVAGAEGTLNTLKVHLTTGELYYNLYAVALSPTVLPDGYVQEWTTNPYGRLFSPDVRRIYFGAAGGGETTGTLAATDGADAAEFTGTHTPPAVTGTLAATDGADAAAFIAAHAVPVTATLAATDGADLSAFAAGQTTSATLAATDGADVAAFNAINGNATIATLAATDGADAAAFAAGQTSSATLAANDGADIVAFAAAGILAIVATFNATDGADSSSFITTGGSIWTDVGVSAATWSDVSGATSIWTDL